jgi:hypothetical protein
MLRTHPHQREVLDRNIYIATAGRKYGLWLLTFREEPLVV